jgi:hypothetical protein
MLGSSEYGGRFAAVNGLRTAFAHQINPEPAVDVLRDYRREFRPSSLSAEPRSMIPPAPTRMVLVPDAMCAMTSDVAAVVTAGVLWCSATQIRR